MVSSTLQSADWNNSTIMGGDLAKQVAELVQSVEGDILVAGSARLVQALTDLGLVDEYRLMVYPIVLGDGKRLFSYTSQARSLRLVDAKALDSGILALTYQPA